MVLRRPFKSALYPGADAPRRAAGGRGGGGRCSLSLAFANLNAAAYEPRQRRTSGRLLVDTTATQNRFRVPLWHRG